MTTSETEPVLGRPGDFPERPAGKGRFVVYALIGVLAALAAFGWGYVMWTARSGGTEVAYQVVAFDADRPDHVTVTFRVGKPAERTAVCRLRALDVNHAEVGVRDVTLPPGKAEFTLTERIEISGPATTGYVQHCRLVQ